MTQDQIRAPARPPNHAWCVDNDGDTVALDFGDGERFVVTVERAGVVHDDETDPEQATDEDDGDQFMFTVDGGDAP